VQFVLLLACVLISVGFWIHTHAMQQTRRMDAAKDAVSRMYDSTSLIGLLGNPIKIQSGMQGEVTQGAVALNERTRLFARTGFRFRVRRGFIIGRINGNTSGIEKAVAKDSTLPLNSYCS
jgi:hypothetical protein